MNKLFTLALVLLFSISIANAGLFSLTEKNVEQIDAVFPELIYNTNDCLVDCSAQFKYCIDSDSDYEMNFNIPEVTSYGYYTTESETHKENTDKCLKEETLTYKCTEEELRNESGCKDYDYTVCNEWEQKDVTTEKQIWHYGLPSEKAGCYEVTIYGKKKANENVDWQPTIVKKGFLWDTEYTQSLWAWWNNSWATNRLISGLTGNITYMNLTYANYTGMNTTWQDMRFVATDNTTALNHTIENYTTSGWALVRLNTLGATSVYIYYNNPTATTTQNASNTYYTPQILYYFDELNLGSVVWNRVGVNGTNGTIGKNIAGVINNSVFLPANTESIITNIAGQINTTPITISFWLKTNSSGGTNYFFIQSGQGNFGHAIELDGAVLKYDAGNQGTNGYVCNGSSYSSKTTGNISDNVWRHFVWNDNSTHCNWYVNGILNASVPKSVTTALRSGDNWSLGKNTALSNSPPLFLDEFYIYNYSLSSQQIFALYNQTAPTFTLGAETSQDSIWAFGTPLPANFTNISSSTINFNATPQGSFATMSCNLTINGTVNMTNSTVQNNTLTNFQASGIAEGYHNYTIDCWNGTTSNSTFVRYFTVDTTLPDVWFTSPTESAPASFIARTWAQINATATDLHMANMTLEWNYTNLTFNTSTYTNATYQRGYSNLSGLADGEYYFRVFANDTFGNWNVSETRMVEVDTIAPTTTATAVGNTTGLPYTWSSTSLKGLNITLTCDDGAGSGCNVTQYCIDDFDVCVPNITYTGTISSVTSGTYYIRFFSNDTVNNTETTHSENFIISYGSPANLYYLAFNDSGDTYVNSSNATKNYGTLTTMNTSSTPSLNRTAYVWFNATDLFSSGSKIYATYFNYTIMSGGAGSWNNCTTGLNYTAQNETTLTYDNLTTICTTWATGTYAIPSSTGTKTVDISNTINSNSSTWLQILRAHATSNAFYTKEFPVQSAHPLISGMYAGAGNIFVNSASDSSTGAYMISNVSFTNTSSTISFVNIGTTSYGSGNFSYVSSNQMNGLITTTVVDRLGLYYPAHFYHYLYNTTAPIEIYPALVNKTGSFVGAPTFYVVNPAGVPVTNAILNVYNNLNGAWVLSQQGLTDSSGAVTMFLYTNVQYRITATDGTTTSSVYTITPTLPSYSIILGIAGANPEPNIFDTINWLITPLTYQIPYSNSTPVTFKVSDSASSLDSIEMWLYYANNTLITHKNSSVPAGATLTANINTTVPNNTLIKGFFGINRIGFADYNITRNFVIKQYTNYSYSLTNVMNAFKNESSISDGWKQIIVFGLAIGCAIAVFKFAGDMGALLTFAVVMTVAVFFGWIGWVVAMIIWLLVVGYAFIRGGMF